MGKKLLKRYRIEVELFERHRGSYRETTYVESSGDRGAMKKAQEFYSRAIYGTDSGHIAEVREISPGDRVIYSDDNSGYIY